MDIADQPLIDWRETFRVCQGAYLVAQPDDALGKPALLTDGTIRVPEHWWQTHISEDKPSVLTWAFREHVNVESIILHQNPLAPASDVMIAGSDDGEVFASDAAPVPSGEQVTCSNLVEDITEDRPLYAQLIAACGEVVHEGKIVWRDRPKQVAPQILAVHLAKQDENNFVLHIRTRAGGSTTNLSVSAESDDGTELVSSIADVGKWDAARDSIIQLDSGDASPARIRCDIRNSHNKIPLRSIFERWPDHPSLMV